MPAGATPLDFAYHVHTAIGHRCRGARVNGRIVPLTYKVKNGDRIEIITGKEEQPSRDWLSPQAGYLASPRSRTKVRSWFRQQDRDQNRKQGRENLERELARIGFKDVAIDTIAERLHQGDVDALYTALGAGDVTPAALARVLQQMRGDAQERVLPPAKPVARQGRAGRLVVRGVDDLLWHLARCCRPVAPEDIVGYITQGRGVSIHLRDCGNFRHLQSAHPERVIEVEWGEAAEATWPAELVIRAYDRQGLLRDIVGVLADEKVGVTASNTRTDRRRLEATIELEVAVPGLAALSRVMSRLEQLPNVTSVKRGSA
jgi:GTP pyrophosphokinase